MAQTPADRRRAQRKLAADIRAGRRNILESNLKGNARQANEAYARDVMAGRQPMPEPGSREAKGLARLASQARWGKGTPLLKRHSPDSGIETDKSNLSESKSGADIPRHDIDANNPD
jgi:hypothetical protein